MDDLSRRRGFTLIEVMIVIAVVSILLALFIPALRAGPRAKLGCLAFGYPETRQEGGRAYCLRQLGGTDEVVELEKLREGQEIESP